MKRSLTIAPLVLVLVAAFLTPGQAAEKPVQVDGFTFVKTVEAISEYTLDANGLTVLVLSDHSSPVATFMVTYRVGSRNEVTGTTGATHLLEHLMFKGSTNFNGPNGKSVKVFLESIGGNYNASTWLDRTNYFAEIGRDHLEGYIEIEADRMRNLWLHEDDRRPEMTVVRNEFEIGENDPVQALDKEISAAAFEAHPYHHPTIGWRSDIEKVSIEKLREFYDTFYWPDNATVSIIGDIDPTVALGLVKKYYGGFTRAPKPIPQVYTEEPEQTGPRRVTVRRAGELGVVGISFKTPAARDADMPALQVLASIMGSGKTSRFYRELTDKNLTTSVETDVGFFHDPSLFQIYAHLAPGVNHDAVEKIIWDQTAKLAAEGVTKDEVKTAIGKRVAATAYARDGSFAIASSLNEDIAVGDWTLYYHLTDAVKQVTVADVNRVARRYLDENRSVTGWFIPLVAAAPHPEPAAKP